MAQPTLYIISDLHVCDGSRVEDFLPADERALVAFLFRISRDPAATLIINGDFIDFVQIQPRPQMWFNTTLDASEDESLEKLERAIQAHGPVFDALGRFVASGHTLRFHFGNHDIDLVWPRVQARIRQRIAKKQAHDAISFGEAYTAAGVHVEHGHQADAVNSFPTQPDVIHLDPHGVPRLERCWGTRLVEEFYNKIEVLDGCAMLDNVRPRLQAAVIIIKHALTDSRMHATLYTGLQVILQTLAGLHTEQDVTNAAEQLGVNRRVLSWLVSVAGWLGVGARSRLSAKGDPRQALDQFMAPSLQTAYAYGASLPDATQLARLAPYVGAESGLQPSGLLSAKGAAVGDGRLLQELAQRAYHDKAQHPFLRRAAELARRDAEIRAVCFGHTHQPITADLAVDDQPGWPLADTTARYFNSGSWTRTLDLRTLAPEQTTFAFLAQPEHYRQGRDYLRVTWPDESGTPQVETLAWT